MRLLVVIPTCNRAESLNKTIGAIASARAGAGSCEVEVFISDNGSTDSTPEVVAQWQRKAPWIHGRRQEESPSSRVELLRSAFTGSSLEYDYAWLQTDEDWITDATGFTQLQGAIEADPADPPAIVHCCATRRALPGDARIIGGNTEDLCNTYGWHDLLGWISSLVLSRQTVERMLASPQWALSTPSAFSHSEALLEAAYGQTMLVLAAGLIDTQTKSGTPESLEGSAKVSPREAHWGIIPGLMNLKRRGVLEVPLTIGFFRYLTYSFWDRFAVEVMSLASDLNVSEERIEGKLKLLGLFSSLLGYGEDRKLYGNWVESFTDDVREVRRAVRLRDVRIAKSKSPSYSYKLMAGGAVESGQSEDLGQIDFEDPAPQSHLCNPQPAPKLMGGFESPLYWNVHNPCPVCGGEALPLDVVDLNKSCEEARGKFIGLSGIPVYYFLCENCKFCFSPELAKWELHEFEEKIYNKDYALVDPDYLDTRPRNNAKSLISLFGAESEKFRHLDFGGGNGLMSRLLQEAKWHSTSFDPFVDKNMTLNSLGHFDLITAFEVFEHSSDVSKLMEDLTSLLTPSGIVLFSTLVSDNNIVPYQRINWWYASPRNGHISLFSKRSLALLGKKQGFKFMSFSDDLHAYWKQVPSWATCLIPANG